MIKIKLSNKVNKLKINLISYYFEIFCLSAKQINKYDNKIILWEGSYLMVDYYASYKFCLFQKIFIKL